MVSTRSTTRKERENKEIEDSKQQQQVPPKLTEGVDQKDEQQATVSHALNVAGNSSIKAENSILQQPVARIGAWSTSSRTSSSSVVVRRKQLELEAARRKAEIQMELIDKKLELDLANLMEQNDENYSPQQDPHTEREVENHREVEKWLDQSHREPENEQRAHDNGNQQGSPPPPPPPPPGDRGASDGTVRMLASAIHNLTTATAVHGTNNNLLSRICTPRDLPNFSGDPLEWLQFKQTYEESTEVCGFTAKENLWRLRKCLTGPAKESVSALMISATSPDIVIKTLELLFGNPDCIINKIMQGLKRLPPMSVEYNKDIVCFAVKVQNFIAAVRAVGRNEYLQGVNIVSIILSKLPTVLISKWSDYSFPIINKGKKSRLEILGDFLNEEAVKITTTANIHFTDVRNTGYQHMQHKSASRSENNNFGRPQTVLLQSTPGPSDNNKCLFCRVATHILTECKQFKRALRKDRWRHIKRNGLCYKCLVSRHNRDDCSAPACDKEGCGESHHRLLHYAQNRDPGSGTTQEKQDAPRSADSSTVEIVTHVNLNDRKVLLKVVPIRVHGPNGVIDSTALLDDGSSVSLISADLARRAGLRGRSETMRVRGAFNNNELKCDATIMNVDLSGIDNKVHNIKMRCINELSLPLQSLSILNCFPCSYLTDITDYLCTDDVKPELLIGQDNQHLLLPLKIRLGRNLNEPSATLTPLGWCVHGNVCVPQGSRPPWRRPPTDVHTNLFISGDSQENDASTDEHLLREIHEEVRRSFAIECLGVSGPPRQNADEARAVAQLERSAALAGGRWRVGLPWRGERGERAPMPDAYPSALHRMKTIEKKMEKDKGFSDRYRERINHLLHNDYAMELKDGGDVPRTWYLPHFGVDNPNKEKLRLVFDAAAKVHGRSLNDYLLTGPDLLSSLLGIMLRFREHRIAVTGDIKDMFLRIKIHTEDQHALRFLWRDTPTEKIKTYVMTSLIFGASCSPFVAQFIKNKNARRYESSMPAAVDAICNSHYMDDYIHSLPDEATAIEMVKNVSEIHKSGGFEIRNWTSNSVAVLESVPKETLGKAAVRFKVGQQFGSERTLGLIWFPADDMLGFDVSLKRIPESIINGEERPTKRLMLKVIMSIFDVLGFLAPFTIQGRIMLQDTWRLNIGWDDYIPDEIYYKWQKWIDLLKVINNTRIPRCYKAAAHVCESDGRTKAGRASERQDAPLAGHVATTPPLSPAPPRPPCASTQRATSYEIVAPSTSATTSADYYDLQLHIFSDASMQAMCTVGYWRWVNNGLINVTFILSKCRVMPVKPLTVPRAELQAALLAARLASTIEKEHKLTPVRRYFWCDSTTVLHWIRNNTRTYKTFEANRLGEIDELTRVNEWRYVPTKLNVADLATRENFDQSLQGEWFTGPTFLYSDECSWPRDVILPEPSANLECVAVVQGDPVCLPVPDPQRFSSWLRLTRATAAVLKFIALCRGRSGRIECNEMERAKRLLLQYAQAESFADELSCVSKGKPLHRSSRLLNLSPKLDEHGLLRASGRIDAATDVALEMKQPVILDGRHPIARLIIRHYHVKAAHGYQETVVNEVRQKYWILGLRPAIKFVSSRCMLCRIRKSRPLVPRMGDLPRARMAHHQRPFSHCGLDLFGPLEVTVGRRREKRYGALFTCLTVRAIHIELVASLTTDSLVMALRRMAARRGWPCHLYSDNGTNLRGAATELQRSMQALDTKVLQAEGVNNGMEWSFIPPASPHWGGAWERLIRSVKTSLKVILNERAPRDEVLNTLMAEVENIVNGRPLMHVSVEPGAVESLTPNHFLLGTSSNLPVIGAYDDSDLYLRKQWRTAQRLADMYWHRWIREILPDLIPRTKWQGEQTPLQIGDLVLVVDPNSPRNTWPKGIVTQVFPGKDGRVRLVEVRTATGTWRRSAARVAPIPLVDECCDQH